MSAKNAAKLDPIDESLYQANLLGGNLVLSFSSSLGSSASKNLKTQK
jgi:tolC protein